MARKKTSEKQTLMAKQRKEQRQAAAKITKKKKKTKKIIVTTVSCVAAVGIISGISVWAVRTHPLMHLIPVEHTEHYSVNAAELSFYSWQIYQRYMENDSSSTDLPDEDRSLANQNYDDDTTWEEYFTDAAKDYAQNIIILCEAAESENHEPSEDISAAADDAVAEFDIASLPTGVTKDDVKHAMELYLTAWDFSVSLNDSLQFTDDELNAYYEENAKTMQLCNYDSFSIPFNDSDETATAQEDAETLARDLRRCTTKESFEKWVYDYYKENTSLSEEDLQAQIATLYTENATYTEDDVFSEWAFSGETKAGDTTILTDTENGTITVYLLLSEPARDETYPINIRQVLFTADNYGSSETAHSAAESALEEWGKGEKTEDSFAELANNYSEDTSADGGLYSDVTQSQMLSNWKDWCFDPSRKEGDVTILDSSYGTCIVYYISANEKTAWEATATSALEESTYEEKYADYQEKANVKITDFALRFVKSDSNR